MSGQLQSCVYDGWVVHRRTFPKLHEFKYQIYLWFLKLDEIDSVASTLRYFSSSNKGLNAFRFDQNDYVNDESGDLQQRIFIKMQRLANANLQGDLYMLGQIRTFGLYFSPVNFYFLRGDDTTFTHMLAEVSNTPWNERHYYLVDLANQTETPKAFHVSPFNPMDMIYRWNIPQPESTLKLKLSCIKQRKHFEASLDMQRIEINHGIEKRLLTRAPSMTVKTVVGIYWQALRLFLKRLPIYSHPDEGELKRK